MPDISELRKFKYFEKKNLTHSVDKMTNILNRETIISYVNYLIKNGKPFSFSLVDIDNFKNVNDTFGHVMGDKIIINTAEYLCSKVGGRGVVGRYGGDEFLIVIEGLSEYKDVWEFGHNINMNIGNIKSEGLTGLHITLTMGITRYPLDASTFENLLLLADKALYRGKTKGRNCFIIYLEEKHKNIDNTASRSNKLSSMHLCSNVFTYLTESDRLEVNISNLFKRLVSYFMFDHMCIEMADGINFQTIHNLSKSKDFKHIDHRLIKSALNNLGFTGIGRVDALDSDIHGEFASALKEQSIGAVLYCRIAAYGREYGYIRVDMAKTVRIWQSGEMDVIVVAANTLGLLLYYNNKSLEDLDYLEPVVIGQG